MNVLFPCGWTECNLKYHLRKDLNRTWNKMLAASCCFNTQRIIFFFTMAQQPTLPPPSQWAKSSALSRIHDHTQTHYSRWDSSGRRIDLTQRPVLDNTQHNRQTSVCPGGIWTRNPNKRAAKNPRLIPRGNLDRHSNKLVISLSNGKTVKKKH